MEVRFCARPEGLTVLHTSLDGFFAQAADDGAAVLPTDQLALRTAAGEIAANIVEHACRHLPDPSMSLLLERYLDRVELTFDDPGTPYVVPEVHDSETIPLGGRGMMLVEASVDTVDYVRSEAGNRWRLVRRAPRT